MMQTFLLFTLVGMAILAQGTNRTSKHCSCQVPVSDAELRRIGEILWSLDVNNLFHLITINTQGSVKYPELLNTSLPLLSVQPEAWMTSTVSKLIALQDNYIPAVETGEVVTPEESLEENEFLDAILCTSVMRKIEKFLGDKGYIGSRCTADSLSLDNGNFRETLRQIWFGLYSRHKSILSSSGFEHSFVGELKNGKISGFHNWIYFARQEENNLARYNGHIRTLQLGQNGLGLKHNFKWNSLSKPGNSMFVGTSPEFEMAVYTLCYYTRPGYTCPLKLGGKSIGIKTHYIIDGAGKKYVASAYPEL